MKAEHRIKASEHSAAAEHRKDLRTNVLADRMGKFMQTVRQKPQGKTVLVWIGLVVALVAVILFYFWRQASITWDSEGWVYLNRGLVDEMIEEYKGTKQADIARYERAWAYLWDFRGQVPQTKQVVFGGIASLKSFPLLDDKKRHPLETIRAIKKELKDLYDANESDPILGPEALYHLAVAHETLAMDDIDELKAAKKTFTELATSEKFKDSARAVMAKKRLEEAYNTDEKFNQLREFYLELGKGRTPTKKILEEPE